MLDISLDAATTYNRSLSLSPLPATNSLTPHCLHPFNAANQDLGVIPDDPFSPSHKQPKDSQLCPLQDGHLLFSITFVIPGP